MEFHCGVPSFPGNVLELNDRFTASTFHRRVSSYGGVVKVHGLFNVRVPSIDPAWLGLTGYPQTKAEELYVTDPRALKQIILRDADSYEESRFAFIVAALLSPS